MIKRRIDFVVCGRRLNMLAVPAEEYLARKNEILLNNYAILDILGSDFHEIITKEDLDTEELIEARELPELLFGVFVALNTFRSEKAEEYIKEALKDYEVKVSFEKKTT
ncbi:MAG: hypothetical protein NC548_32300 [Lachnospiraceae bacterium]|nr:hypothetical protein [Lachnospiraceae bacterium]